jgi:dCMP deaminase
MTKEEMEKLIKEGGGLNRISWDQYFMELARLAAQRSTCLSRQVGAVVVKDRCVLSTGYNGAAKGSAHCDEVGCIRILMDIPSGERMDICRAVHAEQNALLQAARHGVATEDATMYITVTPCFTCGKMNINAGIKEIVVGGEYPDQRTMDLFKEVGVNIRKI